MKEKLQEYALIAEIVSAICIVLSLVFVGLQVRQGAEETSINTRAIQATVRESMLQSDINILLFAGDHQALPLYIWPSFEEDLTEAQQHAIWAALISEIRSREFHWIQFHEGLLDEATYRSYRSSFIANLATNPRYQVVWQTITASSEYNTGFVTDINAELQTRGINIP